MIRARTILAIILVAIGLVWVGQGTGLLAGRSFMVGDPRWAMAGGVAVALGVVLVATAWRDASG